MIIAECDEATDSVRAGGGRTLTLRTAVIGGAVRQGGDRVLVPAVFSLLHGFRKQAATRYGE